MWRGTSVYRTHDGRPTAPCPVLQIVGVVSARLERCERLVDTFNPFGSEKWLGYIMTIGVAEVYRCRGIGSRLLQVRRRRPANPLRTHSPMRSAVAFLGRLVVDRARIILRLWLQTIIKLLESDPECVIRVSSARSSYRHMPMAHACVGTEPTHLSRQHRSAWAGPVACAQLESDRPTLLHRAWIREGAAPQPSRTHARTRTYPGTRAHSRIHAGANARIRTRAFTLMHGVHVAHTCTPACSHKLVCPPARARTAEARTNALRRERRKSTASVRDACRTIATARTCCDSCRGLG
jgi:hypothetical protein